MTEGLKPLADGTFLWVYEEAKYASLPSVNQFVKVGDDLNVLSRIVLDETDENNHVQILDATIALDGDLIVAGSKGPVGVRPQAYVAKINGMTGVVQRLGPPNITLYPNPGKEFTLQWNDPTLAGSTLQVCDAQGRNVQRMTLRTDQTAVDATAWSTGLYHYRITDRAGKIVQQGKWMRE